MNLIKCPNNHFYNADHYPSCPECAVINRQSSQSNNMSQEKTLDQHNIATDSVERSISDLNSSPESMLSGWLVCIDGSEYGHSFPINSGTNAIGRGANMDIHLPNDPEISRYIHAVITYNTEEKTFYLENRNGANPIMLNDTIITADAGSSGTPVILHDRDRIKIGGMTFIFVSFCGKDFNWED